MKPPFTLSDRQRQAYDAIAAYQQEHGYSPSLKELAGLLKLRDRSGAKIHVDALVKKGFAQHEPGRSRSLVLLQRESETLVIPADWQPTPHNINALPGPLRRYINDLHTLCDPAGMVAENTVLKDVNRALQIYLDEATRGPSDPDEKQEVPPQPAASPRSTPKGIRHGRR